MLEKAGTTGGRVFCGDEGGPTLPWRKPCVRLAAALGAGADGVGQVGRCRLDAGRYQIKAFW